MLLSEVCLGMFAVNFNIKNERKILSKMEENGTNDFYACYLTQPDEGQSFVFAYYPEFLRTLFRLYGVKPEDFLASDMAILYNAYLNGVREGIQKYFRPSAHTNAVFQEMWGQP